MGLVLQLVKTRAGSKAHCVDVLELSHPSDLRDIASLGLTLPEAKQLLARVQQAAVAVQARAHAALRRSRTALGGGGAVPQLLDSPIGKGVQTWSTRIVDGRRGVRSRACGAGLCGSERPGLSGLVPAAVPK